MEQSRVVGIKQVKKARREGRALEVILADDADPAPRVLRLLVTGSRDVPALKTIKAY